MNGISRVLPYVETYGHEADLLWHVPGRKSRITKKKKANHLRDRRAIKLLFHFHGIPGINENKCRSIKASMSRMRIKIRHKRAMYSFMKRQRDCGFNACRLLVAIRRDNKVVDHQWRFVPAKDLDHYKVLWSPIRVQPPR